uniref:hypothetical protein n=1 Tax=Clostridium sp. TaxID=1506 RepID=UPI0026320CB8
MFKIKLLTYRIVSYLKTISFNIRKKKLDNYISLYFKTDLNILREKYISPFLIENNNSFNNKKFYENLYSIIYLQITPELIINIKKDFDLLTSK